MGMTKWQIVGANAGRNLALRLRSYYESRRLDEREWLAFLKQALDAYDAELASCPLTDD